MKRHERELLRTAEALVTWLVLRDAGPTSFTPPADHWQSLTRRARQQRIAGQRGWRHAEKQVAALARRDIERLRHQLGNLAQQLAPSPESMALPTVIDIFRDLKALEQEFPKFVFDRVACQLSVTTEPISLEGTDLGAFEIQLSWDSCRVLPPYRVVAVNREQSWGTDNITHPHVQNDELCEGQGTDAIQQALEAGRFFDFFLLVSRVLNTYAPGSAYLQLDDANQANCGDCGDTVSADECSQCLCGESLCDRCSTCCEQCESTLCSSCSNGCSTCKAKFCQFCLNFCPKCQTDHCDNCQQDGGCDSNNKEPMDEEKCISERPGESPSAKAA